MADLGYAFNLPPEDALRYFEGLGYTVPADWRPLWNEAQAKARAVSGIYRQDVTAQFHGALYDAMAQGKPFEAWRDEVRQRLAAHDWQLLKDGDIVDKASGEVIGKGITKTRLETIYRTQTQAAYMAGKWQTFEANRELAPYLQYSAILDSRTRKSHEALHGAVYHIDDAFWDYFYPPNGFNCRCTVRAFSESEVKARGLAVRQAEFEDTHIVTNKKGATRPAKALKLPDGRLFAADKGFEGNVGKNHLANLGQLQMQRAVELPPKLASAAVGAAMKHPEMLRAVSRQAAEMVKRVAAEKVARGQLMYAGALTMPVLEALAARRIHPQSAVIAMSDERVLHGLRDSKVKPLPSEFWEKIPELLLEPEAVLLGHTGKGKSADFLLFVYPADSNSKAKLVVTVDYQAKTKHPFTGKKEKIAVNMVNTGSFVEQAETLYKSNSYTIVWRK